MSNIQVQLRRGTTTQHGLFTGAQGELTVDTDKNALVLHDGSTVGGVAVATAGSINPLNYGAKADGTEVTPTNDSVALKNAIEAADGGCVDLGGRTYYLTGQVSANCPNGVILQNGRILCNYATQAEYAIRITTNSYTAISNISINGQDTVAKLLFIRSSGSNARVFVNNYVGENALQTSDTGLAACLSCISEVDGDGDLFQSVHITNSSARGVDSTGGSQIGRGFLVDSSRQTLVTNCHFESIGPHQDGDGIFVTDATAIGTLRFVLSNCTFVNCEKRAIKSQVANTRISNVTTRRTLNFTASAGQCEIGLQNGGTVDGFSHYFNDGCAAGRIVTVINQTNDNPVIIKNVTVTAADPNDVLQNVCGFEQRDNIYSKNVVVESIQGNCYIDSFADFSGEGFDPDPGTKYSYLFDGVIFRDIKFLGFNPSPVTDSNTGQTTSAFLALTRSATAYIEVRYSMYDIFIGTDNTYPSAWLNSAAGTITYLTATLSEYHNVKGQDKKSYTGTGTSTYTASGVSEYVPTIPFNGASNLFLAKSENIAEDETYSQAFQVDNDESCKVLITYGSRDGLGLRLYTEGIVVSGGNITKYFETVAGDKTGTNTGAISITATESDNQFTIAKTAGTTADNGKLQIMIWHAGSVTEV